MAYDIQQSTTQAPLLFLLVQSSDHITGLTGASPTVTISKAGGSFASPSGSVTEIANGWYKVAGNATDTNTLGPLALHATAASGDPCDIVVANIVAYNPQDAVRAGLTALPNAAANAAGGLPVSAAGGLDLDEMNVDIEAIQVDTAAVKVQTDKLTFTVANQVDVNVLDWKSATAPAMTGDAFARLGAPAGASVSADIASIKTDTGTTIPGLIAALNNISSANVKTQVVAALSTDTYAEPAQGAPTSTIDLATKISFLYKALINKYTQTATTFSLYNAAAAVVDQKSTCSDDGTTATRGKIVTGP